MASIHYTLYRPSTVAVAGIVLYVPQLEEGVYCEDTRTVHGDLLRPVGICFDELFVLVLPIKNNNDNNILVSQVKSAGCKLFVILFVEAAWIHLSLKNSHCGNCYFRKCRSKKYLCIWHLSNSPV